MHAQQGGTALLADTKLADDVAVAIRIALLEVVKQTPPLAHEHEQTAPGAMIFLVSLEMLGQFADAFAQDGDLNLGATRIRIVRPKFFDNVSFLCRCQHSYTLLLISKSLFVVLPKDSTAPAAQQFAG